MSEEKKELKKEDVEAVAGGNALTDFAKKHKRALAIGGGAAGVVGLGAIGYGIHKHRQGKGKGTVGEPPIGGAAPAETPAAVGGGDTGDESLASRYTAPSTSIASLAGYHDVDANEIVRPTVAPTAAPTPTPAPNLMEDWERNQAVRSAMSGISGEE